VNPYATVSALFVALEVLAGLAVLCLGLRAWRGWRRHGGSAAGLETTEPRLQQLLVLGFVLAGVGVAGWPLLYLLFDSYVPQWPGVMCVQGVLRIGTGSDGAAGALPTLAGAMVVLKPLTVFAAGTWVVLHLLNRSTHAAPFTGPLLLALAGAGLVSLLDGATQATYLAVPKQEIFRSSGCCTADVARAADDFAAVSGVSARSGSGEAAGGLPAFLVLGGLLALGTGGLAWAGTSALARLGWTVPAVVGAGAFLFAGAEFLPRVVSPALLGLPFHECSYCLARHAPEVLVGVALAATATFAVGWAAVGRWCAPRGARELAARHARRLLLVALFGYLGVLAMTVTAMGTA
jgi:hypothetical protein